MKPPSAPKKRELLKSSWHVSPSSWFFGLRRGSGFPPFKREIPGPGYHHILASESAQRDQGWTIFTCVLFLFLFDLVATKLEKLSGVSAEF